MRLLHSADKDLMVSAAQVWCDGDMLIKDIRGDWAFCFGSWIQADKTNYSNTGIYNNMLYFKLYY